MAFLLWKIYDLVALKGLFFPLPILESRSGTHPGFPYLLGGLSGTDFLMSALGVNQPRAGRGVISPGVTIPFGSDPTIRHIRYKTVFLPGEKDYNSQDLIQNNGRNT